MQRTLSSISRVARPLRTLRLGTISSRVSRKAYTTLLVHPTSLPHHGRDVMPLLLVAAGPVGFIGLASYRMFKRHTDPHTLHMEPFAPPYDVWEIPAGHGLFANEPFEEAHALERSDSVNPHSESDKHPRYSHRPHHSHHPIPYAIPPVLFYFI